MFFDSKTRISTSLLILLLTFVTFFFVTMLIMGALGALFGADSQATLSSGAAVQAIIAFAATALVTAYLTRKNPLDFLGLTQHVEIKWIICAMVVYFLSAPAMNQIIYWNQNMHLPESMSAIEESFRVMEETNAAVAKKMLDSTTVTTLLFGILIVGIITGFGEELLFRGALQGILGSKGRKHLAVWGTAIIFSAIHFQFFGFIPRTLLGVWFGYLMLRSGSIWPSIFAHALNNSMAVTVMWITNRGSSFFIDENTGVNNSGFPAFALISTLLTAAAIWYFFRKDKSHTLQTTTKDSFINGEEK